MKTYDYKNYQIRELLAYHSNKQHWKYDIVDDSTQRIGYAMSIDKAKELINKTIKYENDKKKLTPIK